jgi:arylsulfatase A-like enzyme
LNEPLDRVSRTSAALPLMLVGSVLYGALEAALDPGVLGARAQLQAALLSGVPGLAIGALAWALLAALGGWRSAQNTVARWRRATSRDPASDRGPVLRLHAVLIVSLGTLLLWWGLSLPVFTRLFAMQEEGLAIAFAVSLGAVMLVSAMIALMALPALLYRPLSWVDRRCRLPLPRGAVIRYCLYVALPVFLVLTTLSRAHGDLLGTLGQLIAVPLVVVMAGLVAHVWRVVPLPARWRTGVGVAVIAVWSLALTLSGALGARAHGVGDRSLSPTAALGATLVRSSSRRLPARALVNAGAAGAKDGSARPPAATGPFYGPEGGPTQPYNIVWIVVDALRADKLGAVRDGQALTPSLDRLAREAVVFTRAYSQATSTSYSIPSMLTGRDVESITWRWARNRPQLPDAELTLAERLRAHGYQTAFVLSPFIDGSLPGTHQGYQTLTVVKGMKKTRRLWEGRMSPIATARAITNVGDLAPAARPVQPFFLTVYYGEPHSPYVRHAEFAERFPNTSEGNYESDVAFADLHVGQLIEHLRLRAPLWERTIVIVTADHGEEFGEHGGQRHGSGCYVEAVHVPLVVRIPGVAPARIETPVALVDIVPTLIELVGAGRDGPELAGRSLLGPLHATGTADPLRPIFSTAAHQRADQRPRLVHAVRQEGYTLIHRREDDNWALFHAAEDPGERRDISQEPAHAARLRRMQELLTQNLTGNLGQAPVLEAAKVGDVTPPEETGE